MPTLNDPTQAQVLRHRLEVLSPSAGRRWGKMEVTAMLCHVGDALEQALGRHPMPDQSSLLFRTVVKWVVLHLPMPKGAPTAPAMEAGKGGSCSDDFEAAKARVLALLADTLAYPEGKDFVPHPAFGPLTRKQRGVLTWKHIDHHLRQFGA